MLTKESLVQAKDYVEEEVAVPEWGGAVKVRTLSMGARYEISARSLKDGKIDNTLFAAATLELGMVEPRLSREEADKVIKEKAFEPIKRITDAIWRLSEVKGEAAAKNA